MVDIFKLYKKKRSVCASLWILNRFSDGHFKIVHSNVMYIIYSVNIYLNPGCMHFYLRNLGIAIKNINILTLYQNISTKLIRVLKYILKVIYFIRMLFCYQSVTHRLLIFMTSVSESN